MELLGIAVFILIISALSATVAAVRSDGLGHTPAVRSDEDWAALELPSVSYLRRLL